jgi:steroid delta-isomerase-like uncharacterized protein
MPSEQNKAVINRLFEEVCNGRKHNVATEIVAPNHIYHDPATPGAPPGPDGVIAAVAPYQNAFDDAHWTIEEMLDAGDTIITRWSGDGTHTKEFAGAAPTGRRLHVDGIWICRLHDGKITESWNNWDMYGLMEQVGLVPSLASA